MLIAYLNQKKLNPQAITIENQTLLKEAVWIDLLSPSKEEEAQVEQCLGLDIPTREEMVEIELSSRLYRENGTVFMTATMIAQSDSVNPELDPVTFILTQKQLITIRYIEPQAFKIGPSHLKKLDTAHHDATTLLIELLDATIDRLADTLELVGRRLDDYSKTVFQAPNHAAAKLDYRYLMQQIGANGDLNTKARESLLTFNRLATFFAQTAASSIDNAGQLRLASISKDIASLNDHANFLSTKVNFLLDATLGMVNIEQNNIIKIFSVAAVIFLPPTLIASIYGMNFHFIPELSWKYGYLFSIGLILVAAWLPYKYFKYRKWL
ncbi:MAG TPA: magnesium transporter CorA family protein [Gammaproteobacteria bacterium]|jgi:magnesium transporter|nr:magnesium transporter CorA family protein [Gammaproteobacteria bacterium]